MKVCVIGTGYVGLVTGVCLAECGHHVICIDNNEEKVKLMKSGQSPIYEPGLSELMQKSAQAGNLEFSSDLKAGVAHGDILFIAVGTPALPSGDSDTRYVEAVARGIGSHLREGYKVIVNKSTVPIGSGDWVRMIVLDGIAERKKEEGSSEQEIKAEFDVVSNPEFLREGSAVYDTFNPDRIVLGSNNEKAIALMQELYTPIVKRKVGTDASLPPVPVVVTDLSSAEMIKYAANAFLATKISFINEVANICDKVGADVTQVAKGIGLDSRIGNKFLQAGIGWGGSCFPKDVSALIHTADDYNYEAELLKAAVTVNKRQRLMAVEKLQQELKILKGKTIGFLGLTFKPDTDDMRDAPALNLIEQLSRLGAKLKAYDPIISQSGMRHGLSDVIVETDPEMLADGCDALVLVTDWQQFLNLDYGKMAQKMAHPVMIDGRNFLDRKTLEAAGFRYVGIGH
ncbi:MAG: UDP-glucose/GDP-mannose dehydrogenase family protein [Roseofilum sp. SBFL]|uniref:UDP-glucose dehydrogenase family protein n=1 Tax=unclassified Roseofilum TaxID=2620099 RepID=UPI001B2EBE4F|nr:MULTISPECIES: UDP-glucose/GDP-mannose dehydrogenase family protein [unclassified Roseofilum]MBP0012948.1 UDP-glucose/GDP-mannose dehydrogenase family protein [Roseofilum sp. SID3]MBP0022788.1 UDP-glucose/GDP-mannose dehydrogenase family protein [Roseofilum sp. SID2]MBP0038854.1 UDP-glucose/GDP-mannose dehydrogenase family protein [Roseofilum sp. SID1]MBP0043919.1 UDP-glucose/GDP-mannose dehydrogenase family protein [Roseofilum sp. SBFL]